MRTKRFVAFATTLLLVALAVNVLAFQLFPSEKGKSSIHLVLDNHTAAKAVLDQQRADYTETAVAHVKLAHRPGELGRAASRLATLEST